MSAADLHQPGLGSGVKGTPRPLANELFQNRVDQAAPVRRTGQAGDRFERLELQK
jgi:hypothetical protein